MIVIEHGIDDSHLGLGITSSHLFLNYNLFVYIILLSFCMFSLSFFLSFLRGLAMCRLGGVISAQKVLF